MPATKIADIIVPEVFNPYVVERTAELSALYQSGIISADPTFDALATSGGKLLNMPYWKDLSGDDEVLSDQDALTVNAIQAGQDIACLLMRGKAWGVNDLAEALSGDDPMAAIGDLVAAYWARRMQAVLLSILGGIFSAANMAVNVHDISAVADANTIDAQAAVDACQKLGDAKNRLTGWMMHSAVEASLVKQDLINYTQPSQGSGEIETFLGKRVVVDDGCPVADGVYITYIFGQGAFAYGNGAPPVPTETARDSLAGEDILVNRKHFILHPRGVAFQNAAVVGATPTNAELATASNWSRVYEAKNVRIVAFKHKIA